MHDRAQLEGQVILVVEGKAGPFARQLQTALESMGAETLLASSPAHAREHASCYDFSAAVIDCNAVVDTVTFQHLRNELGGMPLLLYGTAPPLYVPLRGAQFLAISPESHSEDIVRAVTHLLVSVTPPLMRLRSSRKGRSTRRPSCSGRYATLLAGHRASE